jgi:hypothetical protein
MFLPVLPDEIAIDMAPHGFAGVVAVVRPMDVEEKARWFDAVEGDISTTRAGVVAVQRQLVRVEGVEADTDGVRVPFDPRNPKHFGALPLAFITPVFNALVDRFALSEDARKN